MPQTTGGISWTDVMIELSTDNGSTWPNDVSGVANSISQDGGERATEDTQTFSGDTPIVGAGKRASKKLTVVIVYTEGASEVYKIIHDRYEANQRVMLRWFPKGKTAGNYVYTTSSAVISKCPDPVGEAENAKTVMIEFELTCASVAQATF